MNEKLQSIIAECIKVDPSDIQPDKMSKDFAQWDSLAQVLMLSRIMEEFDVQVPFERLTEIEGVQDIIDLVEK